MHFRKEVVVSLSQQEEFEIVKKWAKQKPQVLTVLLENPDFDCPFPCECNRFPCRKDGCNADELLNGHPYRMS